MINTGVVHIYRYEHVYEHMCSHMCTHICAQCRQIWTLWHKQHSSRLADLSEECIEHIGSLGGSATTSKLRLWETEAVVAAVAVRLRDHVAEVGLHHRQLQVGRDVAFLILVGLLLFRLLAVGTEINGAEGVVEAAVGHVLDVGGEEGWHHQGVHHA